MGRRSLFPPTRSSFAEIKAKFRHDFGGVSRNDAVGFAFFVNQSLTVSERQELLQETRAVETEIYHLERMRGLLDAPKGCGIRLEYLRIPMTEEEQWAFWSAMNYDAVRKLLDNEARLNQIDAKLDIVLERTVALDIDLLAEPSSLGRLPGDAEAIETPTIELSLATLCWIHRIMSEDDRSPEALRGRFRAIEVWIGDYGSSPETAKYIPPPAEDVVRLTTELLSWWRVRHRHLRNCSKNEIVDGLAEFHHRFVLIHPFLDGNGRVARLLLDQAARELLNMRVGRELVSNTAAYYESLQSADRGDRNALRELILASLQ